METSNGKITIDPIESIFNDSWMDLTDGNDIPFLNRFEFSNPTKYGTSATHWNTRHEEKFTREQKNGDYQRKEMSLDGTNLQGPHDYDERNLMQNHPQNNTHNQRQQYRMINTQSPHLESIGCNPQRITPLYGPLTTDTNGPSYLPNRIYPEFHRPNRYYDRNYERQPFVFPSEPVGMWNDCAKCTPSNRFETNRSSSVEHDGMMMDDGSQLSIEKHVNNRNYYNYPVSNSLPNNQSQQSTTNLLHQNHPTTTTKHNCCGGEQLLKEKEQENQKNNNDKLKDKDMKLMRWVAVGIASAITIDAILTIISKFGRRKRRNYQHSFAFDWGNESTTYNPSATIIPFLNKKQPN